MSTLTLPPKLPLIRFFGPGVSDEKPSKELLGGKAYSLMTMTAAGLPVPPGFTITTQCCAEYYESGKKWPKGLEQELRQALDWLEQVTGRKLGASPKPLLVAVRSGAAQSMPGMMDTVLNVGLRPELASCSPNPDRFWGDLRDFVRGYGETVCGLDFDVMEKAAGEGTPEEQARHCLAGFEKLAGKPFPTDPWEMLSSAITAVFHSWNSERALKYREHHNVRNLAGTAVTVMTMFPSERSGILFTEDPNRPDQGRIIIEASYGLGEAIVRGHVEPDIFCVDRKTNKIVEQKANTGKQASITDEEALTLAKLGLDVEAFYKTPVDVEWGIADGKLCLLQSRPVRGLDILRAVPKVREEEVARLEKLAAGRPKAAWAVHNLAETLPAPLPLTWDIVGKGFMGNGFLKLYQDLGFDPSDRVLKDGFLELIAGRIYMDVERSAELFFKNLPMEYDLSGAAGKVTEVVLDRPTKFAVERAGLGFLLKLPVTILGMIRASRVMKKVVRTGLDDLQKRILPAFNEFARKARAKKLKEMSDEQLLAEIAERERVALNEYGPELLKPGFLAAYYHGRLASTLELVLGAAEGRALTSKLLAGLEGDKTVESNIALYKIAKGELTMDAYLAEYGHRAVNELELAEPRWSEDPAYPKQRVAQFQKSSGGTSPVDLHHKKQKERLEAEKTIPKLLLENAASSLEEEILEDMIGAQRHMPWRETCKHSFVVGVALVREAVEVLAERWDLGKDIYYLKREELSQFRAQRTPLTAQIQERKLKYNAYQRLPMPELLLASDLQALGRDEERPASQDGVFSGVGVASGIGTGTGRILQSPSEAGDLDQGYVLVCPTTDPSWTPLFVHASGLVVERGGMLSHGAIVARDFGIPAVVLPGATKLIPEGATVRIDGNKGRVEILHPEKP
ncbi:MAG TPA: PEP/pyruvate-binding domain-containing protein [Planctomycetota bacterium]|nr:PEP/pyruvate-binding domain-containing protein [Planctomycetota bacterium]